MLTSSLPSTLLLLDQLLSDGLDVEADADQPRVIQDLSAVEDEGRLLHGGVDAVVVQSPDEEYI